MKNVPIVNFKEWMCNVEISKYISTGATAIVLYDSTDHELVATGSVNLKDYPMPDGCVAIKDYAENEGMLEALMEAGIISEPIEYVPSGVVRIPICRLLCSIGATT